MRNVSRRVALELLEFINDGTIGGLPRKDLQEQRFRKVLLEVADLIAAGDHPTKAHIDLLEEFAVTKLVLHPCAFDRRTLSWWYEFTTTKKDRAPTYSHDLLVIYGARQDQPRDFPGDLRRCHRASCRKFFFESERRRKKGEDPSNKLGRPTKYCSDDCMIAENAAHSPKRSQNFRDRQKESQ